MFDFQLCLKNLILIRLSDEYITQLYMFTTSLLVNCYSGLVMALLSLYVQFYLKYSIKTRGKLILSSTLY